ncbi:uncharacterized protein LOC143374169 [Andrena cerasifolii]|uniref:uncharacterized protein LOC143374169 n=1 Tax=Andrena cerasifolii TaxID=2819439 RepID=UPI004037E804
MNVRNEELSSPMQVSATLNDSQLLLAVKFIEKNDNSQFAILTDSMSAIDAITDSSKGDHITQELQETLYILKNRGKEIILIWIPSHVGIEGNEKADSLAKSACSLPVPDVPISVHYNDLKTPIRIAVQALWDEEWKTGKTTKLHLIRKDIPERNRICLENRKDQVTLTRLRIGHTHLTHPHLITQNEPTECDVCKVRVTIQHILVECVKYSANRNQHKIGTDPNTFNNVLNFLEDIGIRQLI